MMVVRFCDDGGIEFNVGPPVMLAIAGALWLVTGNPSWSVFTFSADAVFIGIAFGTACAVGTQLVAMHLPPRVVAEMNAAADAGEEHWFADASAGVLAALTEELVFRGLQMTVTPFVGVVPAIIIVGVAFGLVHRIRNLWVTMLIALGGIAIGVAFVLTGSIITAIVCHATYNLIACYLARDGVES